MLADRGFRGVTFHEAVLRPPSAKTLAITFDDAYRSVIELAFPILSRAGFSATVFAPTDFVGIEEPWPGRASTTGARPAREELVPMSWEELEHLAQAGWEIGSHTRSHPRLPTLDDAAPRRSSGARVRTSSVTWQVPVRLSPIRTGTTTPASSRRRGARAIRPPGPSPPG